VCFVLAAAGLQALRLAARLDVDDLTGCTADRLQLVIMDGRWQALTVPV
jgi:hypothetical protein